MLNTMLSVFSRIRYRVINSNDFIAQPYDLLYLDPVSRAPHRYAGVNWQFGRHCTVLFQTGWKRPQADFQPVWNRHIVGNANPEAPLKPEEIQAQMDKLNDFLKRGRIINIEKLFTVITRGDAQVVMEYCAYHIGFRRKPSGLQ